MPTKNPISGRPGLSKGPSGARGIRRPSGRNLNIPTSGRGGPRVPRRPTVRKIPGFKRPGPYRRRLPLNPSRNVVQKSAPKLAKTAARRGGLAIAGRFASRALSVYGGISLIADLFELANPFVQDWLRGGWKGYEGSLYPPVQGEAQFEGGQCQTLYGLNYSFTTGCGNPPKDRYSSHIQGPIGEGAVRQGVGQYEGLLQVGFEYGGPGGFFTLATTTENCTDAFCNVSSVNRMDQLPDNCGSLVAPESPNPLYDDPVEVVPQSIPAPGTPTLAPPYTPLSTGGAAAPLVSPVPASGTPTALQPDYEASDNVQVSPRNGSSNELPIPPDYSFDDPRPSKPDGDGCKSPDASPCSSQIFDFLDYLDDKLDREEETEPGESATPPLTLVDFPWVECQDGQPVIKAGRFFYDQTSFPGLEAVLQEQANLANKGCWQDNGILAVPDSWYGKSPRGIPTLVLIFRRGKTRAYHSYSIPHPASTEPYDSPPLGTFTKGNIMATAVLTDNSKCQVNCNGSTEARRVINQFIALVDASFRANGPPVRLSERLGTEVATDVMNPVSAMFYAEGDKRLRPEWRRTYSY